MQRRNDRRNDRRNGGRKDNIDSKVYGIISTFPVEEGRNFIRSN